MKKLLLFFANIISALIVLDIWSFIIIYLSAVLSQSINTEMIILVFLCIFIIISFVAIVFSLIVHLIWKIGTNDFNEMMLIGKSKLSIIQLIISTALLIIDNCIMIFKVNSNLYCFIASIVTVVLLNFLFINNNGAKLTICKYI